MQVVFEEAVIKEGYLCLKTQDLCTARRFVAGMKKKKYAAELKEYRQKRSLDANAMAWELINKIAAAVGLPPVQVYREAVKDIGGNYEVVPIRNDAVDKMREAWEGRGIGWQTDILGPSKVDGYTNMALYYGSSSYDTKQMSLLIDHLIQDAKAMDIDTRSPREIALTLDEWGKASA